MHVISFTVLLSNFSLVSVCGSFRCVCFCTRCTLLGGRSSYTYCLAPSTQLFVSAHHTLWIYYMFRPFDHHQSLTKLLRSPHSPSVYLLFLFTMKSVLLDWVTAPLIRLYVHEATQQNIPQCRHAKIPPFRIRTLGIRHGPHRLLIDNTETGWDGISVLFSLHNSSDNLCVSRAEVAKKL
jgi:hypothetical protein